MSLIDFSKKDEQKETFVSHYLVEIGGKKYPVSKELKVIRQMVTNGHDVHWMSDGEWSMHELLLSLLEGMTDNPHVYISSYAFSDKPARMIADAVEALSISLYCVVDNRIDTRSADALNILRNCCKKMKLIDTHAKVTLIRYYDKHICIIGSANYTTNKRYECGVITCSRDVFHFHKSWMEAELHGAVK